MIKKSLIVSVSLLIIFETFIRLYDLSWDTSQNDRSANLISVQNFVYNSPEENIEKDTIIVGSSISRKLIIDTLGKNFMNLAFNEWHSYDGLELVKMTKRKPACILIETNIVKEPILQDDIKNSLNPLSYYPNKLLKCIQLQNQPVGIVIGYLKNKLKNRIEELKKKKRSNTDLYNYNLQMQKKDLNKIITDSAYIARFKVLKNLVDSFKKENTAIIFFEIPYDKILEKTDRAIFTRKYFHQYFPDSSYKYIPFSPINNYIYSDGVHLSVESAGSFTHYLKTELNNLKVKPTP